MGLKGDVSFGEKAGENDRTETGESAKQGERKGRERDKLQKEKQRECQREVNDSLRGGRERERERENGKIDITIKVYFLPVSSPVYLYEKH